MTINDILRWLFSDSAGYYIIVVPLALTMLFVGLELLAGAFERYTHYNNGEEPKDE